ncbi:hypothetical protein HPB50_028983 [Hyalomma asiaticum]|nr:hypothetical protein HPB50_028983 [Hyalomma asiaticum]
MSVRVWGERTRVLGLPRVASATQEMLHPVEGTVAGPPVRRAGAFECGPGDAEVRGVRSGDRTGVAGLPREASATQNGRVRRDWANRRSGAPGLCRVGCPAAREHCRTKRRESKNFFDPTRCAALLRCQVREERRKGACTRSVKRETERGEAAQYERNRGRSSLQRPRGTLCDRVCRRAPCLRALLCELVRSRAAPMGATHTRRFEALAVRARPFWRHVRERGSRPPRGKRHNRLPLESALCGFARARAFRRSPPSV